MKIHPYTVHINSHLAILFISSLDSFFKLYFYILMKTDRNINDKRESLKLPPVHSLLGIKPATQTCAWTRN